MRLETESWSLTNSGVVSHYPATSIVWTPVCRSQGLVPRGSLPPRPHPFPTDLPSPVLLDPSSFTLGRDRVRGPDGTTGDVGGMRLTSVSQNVKTTIE